MTRRSLAEQLARLFREAGHAHHQAFLAANGEDPDWPAWYAGFLQPQLQLLLGASFSCETLAELLTAAEKEREKRAPGADWPEFYAEYFLSREAR